MLIVRAPMRISLAGGGTDFAGYYQRHGGLVLSTTINRYFYAHIEVDSQADVQITSSDYGTFFQHRSRAPLFWEDGELTLPKAILHHFGIVRGVKIFLASEVPPGTGLGSSSAVAVALVKGLATLTGRRLTPAQIADLACYIEIDKLATPIGVQDQYAAAYGGLNAIACSSSGVLVEPLRLPQGVLAELESRLLLFFTHSSRNSKSILKEQSQEAARAEGAVVDTLHGIKRLALDVREALETGRIDTFGELLHDSWLLKKRLSSGVSNSKIDTYYAEARRHGAIGGKITGAGGGGFFMLLAKRGAQAELTAALEALGLFRMDYRFEASGAQVLTNSGLEIGPQLTLADRAA